MLAKEFPKAAENVFIQKEQILPNFLTDFPPDTVRCTTTRSGAESWAHVFLAKKSPGSVSESHTSTVFIFFSDHRKDFLLLSFRAIKLWSRCFHSSTTYVSRVIDLLRVVKYKNRFCEFCLQKLRWNVKKYVKTLTTITKSDIIALKKNSLQWNFLTPTILETFQNTIHYSENIYDSDMCICM